MSIAVSTLWSMLRLIEDARVASFPSSFSSQFFTVLMNTLCVTNGLLELAICIAWIFWRFLHERGLGEVYGVAIWLNDINAILTWNKIHSPSQPVDGAIQLFSVHGCI